MLVTCCIKIIIYIVHNQVMVSASRQEMVGHLLKDIVDNSERPSLNSHSIECDRYDILDQVKEMKFPVLIAFSQ